MISVPENNSEALPLRRAYVFLENSGLQEEAQAIRLGSYTSTLRRGRVVALLREKELLDKFVADHWPNGGTEAGKRLADRYTRIYDRFLSGTPEEELADEAERDVEETQFARTRLTYGTIWPLTSIS